MRVLLHTCCAPCLAHPLDELRSEGHEVTAFFFNPNIHPYAEYLRRLDAFTAFVRENKVRTVSLDDLPGMEEWFRQVVFREAERCRVCHHMRLAATARTAEAKNFDAFSTTLLYSRFQKHDLLKELGEALAQEHGIPFLYSDWRKGWNRGVKLYRSTGLYRQKYCGCIYSEKERAEKIL
jgi:epoxyqueuosine reductase